MVFELNVSKHTMNRPRRIGHLPSPWRGNENILYTTLFAPRTSSEELWGMLTARQRANSIRELSGAFKTIFVVLSDCAPDATVND